MVGKLDGLEVETDGDGVGDSVGRAEGLEVSVGGFVGGSDGAGLDPCCSIPVGVDVEIAAGALVSVAAPGVGDDVVSPGREDFSVPIAVGAPVCWTPVGIGVGIAEGVPVPVS